MKAHRLAEPRHVKLFKNGRSQAIRIPRDLELPGNEAIIHREGNRLIVEPVCSVSLAQLFAKWEPLNEGLPPMTDEDAEPVDLSE